LYMLSINCWKSVRISIADKVSATENEIYIVIKDERALDFVYNVYELHLQFVTERQCKK